MIFEYGVFHLTDTVKDLTEILETE